MAKTNLDSDELKSVGGMAVQWNLTGEETEELVFVYKQSRNGLATNNDFLMIKEIFRMRKHGVISIVESKEMTRLFKLKMQGFLNGEIAKLEEPGNERAVIKLFNLLLLDRINFDDFLHLKNFFLKIKNNFKNEALQELLDFFLQKKDGVLGSDDFLAVKVIYKLRKQNLVTDDELREITELYKLKTKGLLNDEIIESVENIPKYIPRLYKLLLSDRIGVDVFKNMRNQFIERRRGSFTGGKMTEEDWDLLLFLLENGPENEPEF